MTMEQDSAPSLFGMLQRQTLNLQSPLCNDPEFKNYARASSVEEIPPLAPRHEYADLEAMRAEWTQDNGCNLETSAKDPQRNPCPRTAAARHVAELQLLVAP